MLKSNVRMGMLSVWTLQIQKVLQQTTTKSYKGPPTFAEAFQRDSLLRAFCLVSDCCSTIAIEGFSNLASLFLTHLIIILTPLVLLTVIAHHAGMNQPQEFGTDQQAVKVLIATDSQQPILIRGLNQHTQAG